MIKKRPLTVCLYGIILMVILASCNWTQSTVEQSPTAITVWHYYNGAQQQIFEELVSEFNASVGAEQNMVVESHSSGSIGDLQESVAAAIRKDVGADEPPSVFAAYADTAYEIDQQGFLADLSPYLTQEEWGNYITSYLDEGRFEDGGFKIFPVAKSTEVLSLNWTEWQRFAEGTGVSVEALKTWEGIASLAERYYLWTDAQTPDVPDDGKAFFGRDAFANYIIIGSKQLGVELFAVDSGNVTVNIDEDVMRRLWDNYYVPYINGYYLARNKFRSDDLRTGNIVAFVGATSSASYFPEEVTYEDGWTSAIEGKIFALPGFSGSEPWAVQQGAGMVVSQSDERQEQAAVIFLKWMTEPAQNVRFAISSGYLPVTYKGNQEETDRLMAENGESNMAPVLRDTLLLGLQMTRDYSLYTNRPFAHGYDARQVVEFSMPKQAESDRAAVEMLVAGGMRRTDAVAKYDTDANFKQWYESFAQELNAAVTD